MNIYLFSVVMMIFIYVIIWRNVKRGRLGVRDSILWITLSVLMGVMVWQNTWLDWLATQLQVAYAPSLLFLMALLLCLLFIFDLTIRVYDLQKKHIKLVQTVALLESEREEKR